MGNSLKKKLLVLSAFVCMMLTASGLLSVKAKAADTLPPAAPTNVTQVDATGTTVKLSWSAAQATGTVRYYIQIDNDQNDAKYVKQKGAIDKTSDSIDKLVAGTTYYARVGAYYTTKPKEITWSNYITVFTAPEAVNAKTIKYTDAAETSITVKWDAAKGANGYTVHYWPITGKEATCKTMDVATNVVTIKGLSKNTKYNVSIYAYTQVGTLRALNPSNKSAIKNVGTLPTQVPKLTCSQFTPSTTTGKAVFKFTGSKSASGYEYEVYDAKGGLITRGSKTSGSQFTVKDNGIKKYGFYKVRVHCYVKLSDNKLKLRT